MARINKNSITAKFRGMVGNLVFRQTPHGTVVSFRPSRRRVPLSSSQKAQCSRFAEAVAWAKQILADPQAKAVYKSKLKKGKQLYQTLISLYFQTHKG